MVWGWGLGWEGVLGVRILLTKMTNPEREKLTAH